MSCKILGGSVRRSDAVTLRTCGMTSPDLTILFLFPLTTGKKFENTEMFGQYPLQVNGFKDLHECLEAAMIEGEIESLHSAENSAKSGQEVSAERARQPDPLLRKQTQKKDVTGSGRGCNQAGCH